jgi:hypothetical protein
MDAGDGREGAAAYRWIEVVDLFALALLALLGKRQGRRRTQG